MLTTCARVLLSVAMLGSALLVACDDAPPEQGQGQPNKTTREAPKVAGLPPEMVAAVSAGKSASVISVHFALGNVPTIDQALPVEIAIVPHQDFTSVRAHFESHDALALMSGDNLEPQLNSKPDKAIKHRLVLMPRQDGVYMVTAGVETEGVDGTVTRIFSIPVIVTTNAAKPAEARAPPAPAPSAEPAN